MSQHEEARVWLRANGYDDVADQIDEIILEWKEQGKHTRRNWWDVLAGGKSGSPRTVAGRVFPVLKAAQLRQGRKTTKTSLARRRNEERQRIWEVSRWKDFK